MMHNAWIACFLKELKEQQRHWILILALIPVTLMILGFYIDSLKISHITFVEKTVGACFLIAIFVFGTDLSAGEHRRGTFRFLDRLPVRRSTVFFVKVTAYLFLLATCLAMSAILSLAMHALAGGDGEVIQKYMERLIFDFRLEWSLTSTLSLTFSVSMMMLCISCWIRRLGGSLVLWTAFLIFEQLLYGMMMQSHDAIKLLFYIGQPALVLLITYLSFVYSSHWRREA